LTNNSASPNSQVPQNTMPNASGITLTSPGYTSLQVEGGHLVGIK
jgi:cobalamin biosynthesis protein CobD/CbiB